MKIKTKVSSAIGLNIVLDETTMGLLNKAMLTEADHKAEVRIEVLGKVKEMSLSEFLQKLGFENFKKK